MDRIPALAAGAAEAGLLVYLALLPVATVLPPSLPAAAVTAMIAGTAIRRVADPNPPPYRLVLPVLLFAGSAVVAIAASVTPSLSLDRARYLPIALLCFFVVQDVVRRPAGVRRLCVMVVAVIGLAGLDGVAQGVGGSSLISGRPLFGARATASLPHPNDLGLVPILLPLGVLGASGSDRATTRALGLCALALGVVAIVLSQSRNAWIGVAIALGAVGILTREGRVRFASAALFAVLLAASALIEAGGIRDRVDSLTSVGSEGRIGIWLAAWQMFMDAPLFGAGLHVYGDLYLDYLLRIDFPAGYKPEVAVIPWAHNLWLEMAAERGLVGLGTFTALLACVAIDLARAPASALRNALVACWLALLAMGLFDLTFLKDWVRLVFFLLVGAVASSTADAEPGVSSGDDRAPLPTR